MAATLSQHAQAHDAAAQAAAQVNPKFNSRGTYVVGELKSGADPRYPDGMFKPGRGAAIDLPGRFFTKHGCRTVDAYFEKNPENRPAGVSFFVYQRSADGSLKFMKSGSFTKTDRSTGLSDGDQAPQSSLVQYGANATRNGLPIPGASLMAIQQIVSTTSDQVREIMQTHQQITSNIMEQTQGMVANLMQQNQTILEKYQDITDRYAQAVAAEKVAEASLEHQKGLIEFRKEVEQDCATYYKDLEANKPAGLADPEFLTAAVQSLPHVINLIRDLMKPTPPGADSAPAPTAPAPVAPAGPTYAQPPGNAAVGPNGKMVVMPGPAGGFGPGNGAPGNGQAAGPSQSAANGYPG